MYDACVIGHITKDRIQIPGRPDHEMPGGTAYYVSRAWAALGLNVCVITKVAPEDAGDLLKDLEARGVHVVNRPTRRTTVFENRYSGPALQHRTQRVRAVAEPFHVRDFDGITASYVHLGPLTRAELDLAVLSRVRGMAPRIALDGQGLLREVVDAEVCCSKYPHLDQVLPWVDVLKVDDGEAEIMVDEAAPEVAAARLEALGVDEVLLTFADRGSAVQTAGRYARVAAVPPPATVDATGCGDTFVAGYAYARLRGEEPVAAARFASAAASLKISDYGPFAGTEAEVRAHMPSV